MGHGKEATNALHFSTGGYANDYTHDKLSTSAQSGGATIPLQTPGDGLYRRFQ
ncbi:hypothetical protein [aff. Roholtiella sp. LEGE 12411]|uniref:hypothetical protein n=1 Tax=aff. Roholtiella sp. LEGE 12411 TaxID=1828822 RepID=UPI00188261D1|nr:hypothetical protein [aff. Roholtiella sp. LEGE 12411]MBE9035802.1 hypothetical protein [aff. Roholtiella sp. LEGE 12411]